MSILSRDFTEKRNFIRMQVGSPVEIKTEAGVHYQGTCVDLSGGGMLIEVEQSLAVGSYVVASVMSSHGQGASLRATCSVARVEQAGPNTVFLGLEIQEILNKPVEDLAVAE